MTQETESDKFQSWVGLDVGASRIGIAVANVDTRFAIPKCTVSSIEETAGVLEELKPSIVVVGWPLELDGTAGRATRTVEKFVDQLMELLTFEPQIARWDERLTTSESEHLLREAGKRAKEQRAVIDQVAATKILQSYLDAESLDE